MKTKYTLLLAITCLSISCKDDTKQNEQTETLDKITVTQDLSSAIVTDEVTCGDTKFIFQLPLFEGPKDAVKRLENDVFQLIAADFVDVTYPQETSTQEVYKLFLNRRRAKLCNAPNEGMQQMVVKHQSENEDFVSFEIEYVRDNQPGKLVKAYRKNGMTPITLQQLIKPGKEQDVFTIYNINLQQEAAALALNVAPNDQDAFQDFIKDKVFVFNKEELNTVPVGLRKSSDGGVSLQVAKTIQLPSKFNYLNPTIVLDIPAVELNTYLDFTKVK